MIVGVSYTAGRVASAVRWTPSGSGYTVEVLPKLAGDTNSYATAINNLGQIVGARNALAYSPTGTGWLYSDALGLVNLSVQYGLWVIPWDLNDNGLILAGAEQLDPNTGLVTALPPGPSNYYTPTGRYINNNGQVGGYAPMTSQSLNIVSVFRYDPGAGWLFIAGTSKYTMVTGLNGRGDVGYGELGTGLYLEGLGNYALNSLLDPAVSAAGWAITGSGLKINDTRQVAAVGSNSTSGQAGGVLLTPAGSLQPPTAPTNLQGQPHPATSSEPWVSIDLTWQNTSSLTQSYELERSETGAGAWVSLSLVPPNSPERTSHQDTTVAAGVTYDYRVRAIGLAGPSLWSAVANVTAPTTPLDTTRPVVTITAPANGATVSGTVTVSAQATDDVGVTYLEISYWNLYTGQEVVLGSVSNAGALSVSWNTGGLTPATYAVQHWRTMRLATGRGPKISVNVGAGGPVLRVTNIAMSGSARGSTANISGTVYIKDGSGKAVSGATVAVRWNLPNGTTRTAGGKTGSSGTVKFSTSGPRGTYTLTVTDATRSDYTFDRAGSALSASITK